MNPELLNDAHSQNHLLNHFFEMNILQTFFFHSSKVSCMNKLKSSPGL